MQLNVAYDFLPKQPSCHAAVVMDHFGIGFETGRHIIADGLELPVRAGDLVLLTGPSGSGKSSLMRGVARELQSAREEALVTPPGPPLSRGGENEASTAGGVLCIDAMELGDCILVDALGLPAREAMQLLSTCGLGEAQLMLRTPAELSDGQRYRFRLALGLSQQPAWIVADEFTATLDRTLARVVAFNIRRLCDRTGTGFLLATTHEDIAAELRPSLHVRCHLEGRVEWTRNDDEEAHGPRPVGLEGSQRKKKEACTSRGNSTSPRVPRRIGRTSLGGITAATGSGWCGL